MNGLDDSPSPGALTERRRWRMPAAAASIGLMSVVVVIAFASRFGRDPNYVASAVINREMPSLEMERLNRDGGTGGVLALDDLRGDVIVVNFWASWCPACRAEHDDLIATAAAYRSSGVRFVGVVYQDSPAAARKMLDELGWGYDYVVDSRSRAAIAFGVRGVPETYFIDRNGVIVARISGESTEEMLAAQLNSIMIRPAER